MQEKRSDDTLQRPPADAGAAENDSASSPETALEAGDLRSVERLLAALEKPPADPFILPRRAAPPAQTALPSGALQSWALQPLPNYPAAEQRGGFLAWLFLSLGLMAFACGGVMLGWSVVAGREELWSLGIPLALGGQGAIIFGLIALAEVAAQHHKQTAAALDEHRQRLTLMQSLALAGQAQSPPIRSAA